MMAKQNIVFESKFYFGNMNNFLDQICMMYEMF